MSDKNFDKNEKNEQAVSRRKFIKAGAIAGGAAVVGLSLGIPALTKAATASTTTTSPNTSLLDVSPQFDQGSNDNNHPMGNYKPKERWFFLYTTDGVAWLPTDKFGLTRRPIYMYGYAKPISDTNPSGYVKGDVGATGVGAPTLADKVKAFADTNWIDSNTGQPVMRGKAQINGPPIWGVEGDILDITMFNLGFAFGSCVTDPHTVHLHGVHSPTVYDGIPEISMGIPMWNPYTLDGQGCPVLPKDGTGAGATFTPATADTIAANSFTYRMYCERPGTYMYHCHVEASEHVQMGMSGPMWIYPKSYGNATSGGAAYNNSLSQFDQELFLMYTDIDSRWHDNIMDFSALTTEPNPTNQTLAGADPLVNPAAANFQIPDFRPDWCLVNGRALPDTVLTGKYNVNYQKGLLFNPPATVSQGPLSPVALTVSYYPTVTKLTNKGASGWSAAPTTPVYVPRQPVQTYIRTDVADKMLARVILMGYHDISLHFHGVMPNMVGKDTFALVPQPNSMFSTTTDERRRFFTLPVASGETYDLIASYPDKAAISPTVYGFLKQPPQNNPFAASETGLESQPNGPLPPQFNYGDAVHLLDKSIPMVLGPGALDPTKSTPTPDPNAGVGLPVSNGTGFASGFTNGYPLLYLWHDHDDYLVTNNGSYPGGAVAVIRVDKAGTLGPQQAIPKLLIPI
jgi:manganese oxidase